MINSYFFSSETPNELDKKKEVVNFNNNTFNFSKNSNYTVYTLYEPDGTIIQSNSPLKYSKQGELYTVLSLSHFFKIEGDYGLIILKDYQQSPFEIENEEYEFYPFNVSSNHTVNLHIKVDVNETTNEIVYVIIKKPGYIMEDNDVKKSTFLSHFATIRHPIEGCKDASKISVQYEEPISILQTEMGTGIFPSRHTDKSQIIFHADSNEKVHLRVGNMSELKENLDFAIVAFKDWKQVPLLNGKLVNFLDVSKGVTHLYELTFPETEKLSNYQIIGFPRPFRSLKNIPILPNYSSHRTVIHPSK